MREQSGFVSLFTSILISLLLMVVTLSMISLQALQLRKAEDSEQSLRAYYTAEAGVEDAVSKVLSKQIRLGVGDNTCNNKTDYDIPGAAGWTCQQVSFSGTPFGKLDQADVAKTVDPAGANFQSVVVEWNQATNGAAAFYNFPLPLPDKAIGMTFAAPIELAITQYPQGGFRASEVGTSVLQRNALIVPRGPVGQAGATISWASLPGGGPRNGDCRPLPRVNPWGSTTYNCYALLTGFVGGNDFLFRVRSRYSASAFKMTFWSGNNGNGSIVDVPDGTATIDVTARAGQTYRRVISKLPLNDGAAAGLNYVMYSDGDICKNFTVFDNVPVPGCPY